MKNARFIEEKICKLLMICSLCVIIAVLIAILAAIVIKGLPAINWAMISQPPKGGYYLGKEGGVLNAIVGSLYLAGGATILAAALSIPVVLYLNVYAKRKSKRAAVVRFMLDVLWGVPSIVYGAFGFTVMIFFGLRASLLGGIIAVTFLVMPIMSRAMDEVMRMVPAELLNASYALGATKLETALKVLMRQVSPGVLTAILIAFGRGVGDAASVLFTAGFSDFIPYSLFRPAATLPLAIFFQLGTPLLAVQQRGYASALILTVLILIVSIVSRMLTKRFTRHVLR